MKNKDIAIIGYSETKIRHRTNRSVYDLAGEAFSMLLESTGIEKSKIDGMSLTAPMSEANPFIANYMCDTLGLSPIWLNLSALGGCSAIGGVARAAAAIRNGDCETVVVISADAPSTRILARHGAYRGEFQDPIGVQGPPGMFGLLMSRYEHSYKLIPEALGKIAITQREHAVLNDNAYEKFRKTITMEEYLESRMVCDPLRLYDSVMYCDGANAVIVTTTENAKKMGFKKMVHPVAYSEVSNYNGDKAAPDITETGFAYAGPTALKKAGMTPSDISMFQPYDDFTVAIMLKMEQIGFCGRGEGSRYILDTDLSYNGKLPLNTGGGQISAGQPGLAGGGLNLVEAVRQLFGEGGARQVPNPKNAMVTGIGGIPYGRNWMISAVMILEA